MEAYLYKVCRASMAKGEPEWGWLKGLGMTDKRMKAGSRWDAASLRDSDHAHSRVFILYQMPRGKVRV